MRTLALAQFWTFVRARARMPSCDVRAHARARTNHFCKFVRARRSHARMLLISVLKSTPLLALVVVGYVEGERMHDCNYVLGQRVCEHEQMHFVDHM